MTAISRFMIGMIICVLFFDNVNASRFIYTEQDDPFSEGVCVRTPEVSIGGGDAIRSERFGVTWPHGMRPGIILCNSGFVYFSGDSELTEDEKSKIQEFLGKVSWIDFSDVFSVSPELLVWLLEEIYKRREVDSGFWLEFHQTIALLGQELEALRKSRIFDLFRAQYSEFQNDPAIHYVMSGYYARERLMPEACESLYRGDQIMSEVEHDLSDVARMDLSNHRAYAIADLVSHEDVRYGKIRLSKCGDLRKENEHVPPRNDPIEPVEEPRIERSKN